MKMFSVIVDVALQEAIRSLRMEGIDVDGVVAHVGKDDDRRRLIEFALERYSFFFLRKFIFFAVS